MSNKHANEAKTGPVLWRSLDDLADTPEFRRFVEDEFPNHAPEMLDGGELNRKSRRSFLKVMGASMAMAGAGAFTGCIRWPEEKIHPFTHRPEGRLPGVPVQYATAYDIGGVAHGLLATSYDGRPIKVDGNPQVPANSGSSNSWQQASVLNLYDPARSRVVKARSGGDAWSHETWADVDRKLAAIRASAAKLHILTEASSSQTLSAFRAELIEKTAFKDENWHEYEPVSFDNVRLGSFYAFGKGYLPQVSLALADVIVTFDSDLFGTHPNAVQNAREWASRRRPENSRQVNRLYSLESHFSITGSVADHRTVLRASEVPTAIARLARKLAIGLPGPLESAVAGLAERAVHGGVESLDHDLDRIVQDLKAHPGASVIALGEDQPAAAHALVALINDKLGNTKSRLVTYVDTGTRPPHQDAIANLKQAIDAGEVSDLVILGGNPAYNAPADLNFAAALEKVANVMHLSEHFNETSLVSHWHLPATHYLECWGDGRTWDGTVVLQQPLIAPLYEGRSKLEVLAKLVGNENAAHDNIKQVVTGLYARNGDADKFWETCLHNGVVKNSGRRREQPSAGTDFAEPIAALAKRATAPLEIRFVSDYSVYDGRFANNGWLQEQPDPMTKISWDNAVLMSPVDAEALGLPLTNSMGDNDRPLVELTVAGRKLEAVCFVMPGQAPGSVTLALGYGRNEKVMSRPVGATSYNAFDLATDAGFNAYTIRTLSGMRTAGEAVEVTKSGKTYKLATTQDHFAIDSRLTSETELRLPLLTREVTATEFEANPKGSVHEHSGDGDLAFDAHMPHKENLWTAFEYPKQKWGHKWGMAIDLTACTGCAACVTACTAENNVGVVGKDEVAYGREMHWIRIDRYFRYQVGEDGQRDASKPPEVMHQPVLCAHCENAPCEQVCPVGATSHSREGLNDMVYNRCIGTRYCSNNCPYKVRRFNYFNNHRHVSDPEKMVYNPEVTPRHRGVMEKCTFCSQRILDARVRAKNAGHEIEPNEIRTACQTACPTQAITFGDLNHTGSDVIAQHASDRSYFMLEELNIRPRLKYMARVRNPKA